MLESHSLDQFYSESLVKILEHVPIVREIIRQNPSNLIQILQSCKFFKYLPGEEIIGWGRYSPWFFYLLKGNCVVMDNDRGSAVESIKTGQFFGELDVLLDACGQNTVVADMNGQEVVLIGVNSAIFTVQTSIRLLDVSARICCFQSLFRSLRAKHNLMWKILNNISGSVKESEFRLPTYNGSQNGTDQLMFFDIETKKLIMEINQLKTRIYETIGNRDQGLLEINTFITNDKFNQQDVDSFIQKLSYNHNSAESTSSIDISLEQQESEYKSAYKIQELSFLVVDDDDQYRESAVSSLKNLGAEKIYTEKDGQAAWNLICENPTRIDVLLCDWIMPQMTGLDLYQNMQNGGEDMRNIVFIMLTSIESRTSVLEAVENGVHGYAVKPLSQKQLLKQIQQALKHIRGALLKAKE